MLYYAYKTFSGSSQSFTRLGKQMCGQTARIMTPRQELRPLWQKMIDKEEGAQDELQKAVSKLNKFPYEEFSKAEDLLGFQVYMSSTSMDAGWVRTNLVKDVFEVESPAFIPDKWFVDEEILFKYNCKTEEDEPITLKKGDLFIETESGSQYTLILDNEDD